MTKGFFDAFGVGDVPGLLGRYAGAFKATGRRMTPQAVHVWTLKNGKVVAFQQYIDTLDVAGATGGGCVRRACAARIYRPPLRARPLHGRNT